MTFDYFRVCIDASKRKSFMTEFFQRDEVKKDFHLLVMFEPDFTDWISDKSMIDYNPYTDFTYDILHKDTGDRIRFKMRYFKEDNEYALFALGRYEESNIFHIQEYDNVEEALYDFLEALQEEIESRRSI